MPDVFVASCAVMYLLFVDCSGERKLFVTFKARQIDQLVPPED